MKALPSATLFTVSGLSVGCLSCPPRLSLLRWWPPGPAPACPNAPPAGPPWALIDCEVHSVNGEHYLQRAGGGKRRRVLAPPADPSPPQVLFGKVTMQQLVRSLERRGILQVSAPIPSAPLSQRVYPATQLILSPFLSPVTLKQRNLCNTSSGTRLPLPVTPKTIQWTESKQQNTTNRLRPGGISNRKAGTDRWHDIFREVFFLCRSPVEVQSASSGSEAHPMTANAYRVTP